MLFREKIEINEWNNFCYGFSTEENTQIIFHNGLKMHHYNSTREGSPIAKNFNIHLGRNLRGLMSEFNLYGRLLRQDEMQDWTGKCVARGKPDLLTLDGMYFTFSIHNKVRTKHTIDPRSKMTFNSICKNPRGSFVRAVIITR